MLGPTESILTALYDQDPIVRTAGCRLLGKLPDVLEQWAWFESIKDPAAAVRRTACECLQGLTYLAFASHAKAAFMCLEDEG